MSVATQQPLFGAQQAERTSDDYYTPAWVFERMGITFDLDVCSPPEGVPWIPAQRHFTMEDDGLSQPWAGRVWMNPPYSAATPWVERFLDHGNGVALLPTAKSLWLDQIWASRAAVVINEGAGEMHFKRPGEKKPVRIWFPVLFAALGDECMDAVARLGPARVLR